MTDACEARTPVWEERFDTFLRRSVGLERSMSLTSRFLAAAGMDYRARIEPVEAARDCLMIGNLAEAQALDVDIRRSRAHECLLRIRFLSRVERPLDEFLPWLAHFGLRVRDQVQFELPLLPHGCVIRLFIVEPTRQESRTFFSRRRPVVHALRGIISGELADDALNSLIASTDLAAIEVDVLRAYRNYGVQLRGPSFAVRIDQALLNNPEVVRILFHYFAARFQPARGSDDLAARQETLIEPLRRILADALGNVLDVEEDHILRALFNMIDATLRTNHYCRGEQSNFALALKIDALGVIDMPAPRPLYEIYVHAPDFEGIHLRGARVARGGIRWSERSTDLRAEILDLQQTQMLKNSLIVPQGAKGGFVIRQAGSSPEGRDAAGRWVYRRFIGALLELTDKAPGHEPQRDPRVLGYDEPDSYLVVAADKGTAGFSDLANEVAAEAGFWLGDAFASGGSHGYSHKRFGITARGAWACLRRHFRELGRDLDHEPITVVGVGSMDGDVFGNGMLLSENIRLLGAFSAWHIFLDPNPEPARAYRERQRLFERPRSTWDDYDAAVISSGGGVFSRSAKRIALSPECCEWLGIRHDTVDGEELVRLLLTAPVDLLWFGGIGTYVKSSEEHPEQVGDHANDAVRVDAGNLRAKVVGEGANLSFTARARVEYALSGGRINMDAIDNSGGVDLSDHEVNLKVLLKQLAMDSTVPAGSASWRELLLSEVAGEVCAAVITHNADQSLALSLDEARCRRRPEPFFDLIERFEDMGLIDRKRAAIGSRTEVLGRPLRGLTRPELTQLLAPAKLTLKSALLSAGEFLNLEHYADEYRAYFPAQIRRTYSKHLHRHPLAADITVSQICNRVVDRAGASFLTWTEEPSPRILSRSVSLYVLFDRMLEGTGLREAIRSAPGLSPALEIQLLLKVEDALQELCRWGLARSRPAAPDEGTVAEWQAHWRSFRDAAEQSRSRPEQAAANERVADWVVQGLTPNLAQSLAWLDHLDDFPSVVEVQRRTTGTLPDSLRLYRRVAAWFGWPGIIARSPRPVLDHGQWLALESIQERLADAFVRLSVGSINADCSDAGRFLEALRERGLLSRVARIKQELSRASGSHALEWLVVLTSDAEAAADGCVDREGCLDPTRP